MGVATGTQLLGRFRVIRERGRPGGAGVYDAVDEQSGEPARLVLLGNVAAGEDPERVLERVSRYAIGCGGIARSLGAGLVGAAGSGASSRARQVAVAYAAADSRTLEDVIRGERLGPDEIARLVSQIARALSPLHEQGVAHAYLRPELIALTDDGVSLEGFGVAQLAQSLGGPTLARDALPVVYRAPEQRGAMPARAETWADVYALGVLASELCAAHAAPAHLDAPTPRALGLEVGDALESCIAGAMAPSVGARPRDVELWALRLEAALSEPGALPDAGASPDAGAPESPPAEPTSPEELSLPDAEQSGGAELEAVPDAEQGVAEPPAEQEPRASGPDVEAAAERRGAAPAGPPPDREAGIVARGAGHRGPAQPVPPPPASRRSAGATWAVALAVVGGLLLMVGGVGAGFWYALSSRSATAVATVSPPPIAAPPGPMPVPVPGVPTPGTATPPGATDGGVATRTLPAPALVPSGRAVHRSSAVGVPLPVDRDDPVWGKPDAPVTLLVFGDLDCPYTRRSLDVLRRLETRFSGDLRLVWKNRPLTVHPHARDAAEVAVALEETSGDAAFWKFASQAAASSQSSTSPHLSRWVSDAGGEGSRVKAWLSEPRYAARVDRALQLAGRYNIRATPTFFVNGLRVEGYQPFAALSRVVERELSQARALAATGEAAEDLYADRVRKNLVDLGPAAPERRCPPVAGSPVRGPSDALVTIIEYSDFQCPFCKRVQPTLDTLRRRYGGEVRLVWKNFPLQFHARARPAANFAMEAMARGGSSAFWRVHDALFAAQPSLDDSSLTRIARGAGLDPSPLLDAVRDASHRAAIDDDMREGQGFGVTGTPSFFINGRELTGAQPLSKFESAVDAELAAAKRLVASGTSKSDVYSAICGTR
jgi:protein-disulfide isomerase